MSWMSSFETWIQDARYGARVLRKNPVFTCVALASLALGIGVNTAIFSVADTIFLRPLPYPQPDRLVVLWNRFPGLNIAEDWLSPPEYVDLKEQTRVFADLALAIGQSYNLTGGSRPERLEAMRVSPSFFSVLGYQAAFGRTFLPEESYPGKPKTVLLTDGLWRRRFGSARSIIGESIHLNDESYTVIGVLPADFRMGGEVLPTGTDVNRPEAFLPLALTESELRNRGAEAYNVLGRLRPGVTIREAQADVDMVAAHLKQLAPERYTENSGFSINLVPIREQVVRKVRTGILILLGGAALVLLVTCANVANLLLSRAIGRCKEIALRVAIGASRARLIRQLVVEGVILSLTGGALGLLFGAWIVQWLRLWPDVDLQTLHEIVIDGRIVAFTAGLSILTGLVFGATPAIRIPNIDLGNALKEAGRSSSSRHSLWAGLNARSFLVISEVALSVVLLAGAGLLLHSFAKLLKVDPGFTTRNVLSFRVALPGARYSTSMSVVSFFDRLLNHLSSLPGVQATGAISVLPLGNAISWGGITVDGYQPKPGEVRINADQRVVSTDYFRTMQIPLRRGRLFDAHDTTDSPRAVIIDETMANRFWANGEPIGKRIKTGGPSSTSPWMSVVGVVGNIKQYALDSESRMAMYTPLLQKPGRGMMYVVVRTAQNPAKMTGTITDQVRQVDADQPLYDTKTMEQRLSESLGRRRFALVLLATYALFALVLGAIGIYGVLAHAVSQGTRDIGIRMALGARRAAIIYMIVRRGMFLAFIGLIVGLCGALVVTRAMTNLLFQVSPTDTVTLIFASTVLLLFALMASAIPAAKATRVDPVIALRDE